MRCSRPECGQFWWQPTPENEKTRRPARHLDLVKKYGRDLCELCGLALPQLLALKRHLVGHHVIECGQDGADSSDARDNVWIICNACHSTIHRTRDYYGLKGGPVLPSPGADA